MDKVLPSDRLWNVIQAAQYLGIKPSTLYKKSSTKKIPFVKVGGALRFRKSDLDSYLDSLSSIPPKESEGKKNSIDLILRNNRASLDIGDRVKVEIGGQIIDGIVVNRNPIGAYECRYSIQWSG